MVRRSDDVQLSRNCWPKRRIWGWARGLANTSHDIRVIRLPRHGASCPVGMGVSCSDRNIKAKINRDGIWIEKLENNPGKYIPEELRKAGEGEAVRVDLNRPMKEILRSFRSIRFQRAFLNGTIIVVPTSPMRS